MFNNLYKALGQQPTQDEVNPELEDMYPNSFDEGELEPTNEEILENNNPEDVLNDSSASYELKKMAMQMVKDRYLKPRDKDNE